MACLFHRAAIIKIMVKPQCLAVVDQRATTINARANDMVENRNDPVKIELQCVMQLMILCTALTIKINKLLLATIQSHGHTTAVVNEQQQMVLLCDGD